MVETVSLLRRIENNEVTNDLKGRGQVPFQASSSGFTFFLEWKMDFLPGKLLKEEKEFIIELR